MRFNKLDLNQLVVLDAVLSERSVCKAAARVFLSQPATSCALARLRDYFGDELLVQVGKRMVLTPLAESLVQPIRDVLLQLQVITTVKPVFDPATSDSLLVIESSDFVVEILLTDALRRAAEEAPHMRFRLRLTGPDARERLESGEVDLSIAPDFLVAPGHPREDLFHETFSCLVWAGNTEVGEQLSLSQYLSMGHIVTEWEAGRLLCLDEKMARHYGHERHCDITVPSFGLLPRLLSGTRRVATLPTRLAHRVARPMDLRVLPCPMAIPPLVEQMQWHQQQAHNPALNWFKALLTRVAARVDGQPAEAPELPEVPLSTATAPRRRADERIREELCAY